MTSDRVYRPAFLVEQAINIMKKSHTFILILNYLKFSLNNLEAFINIKKTLKD